MFCVVQDGHTVELCADMCSSSVVLIVVIPSCVFGIEISCYYCIWDVAKLVEGLGVGLEVEVGFPVVTECVVCVGELFGLRVESGVEIGCFVTGALVWVGVLGSWVS